MKLITYMDSYQYYGLWDCTMGYFDDNGTYKSLSNFCKTIDVYNCFGTRDSMYAYVSLADNLSMDNLAYVEIRRNINSKKDTVEVKKENITITYYSKRFERLIPAIMKQYNKCKNDIKITFLYMPMDEEEMFDEKNNLEQIKEFGWFDDIDEIKTALLSA